MTMQKAIMLVLLIAVLPAAGASSLRIYFPEEVTQAVGHKANFSIVSEEQFSGTLHIAYNNTNSTISNVSFSGTDFTGSSLNYSWWLTASEPGHFSIHGELRNLSGGILASFDKTGTALSSIPSITQKSPSGQISQDNAVLSVVTSEDSTCKYDIANKTYQELGYTFANSKGIHHNQSLTGLEEGLQTYFIRCIDSQKYEMNYSEVVSFEVDLPPSAEIFLSDPSPIKAGTIRVTVRVSEDLSEAPSLKYSFDDNPDSKRWVSLTGSGSEWTGYFIITQNDDKKIGAFYFSAKDSSGNIGTKITTGNIFIVDTNKPSAPVSQKAYNLYNGDIKIEWYYDDDDVDYFKIYRSTVSGVDYVDYYDRTSNVSINSQYTDRSTTDKVTYYYRISSVDKSGNEGSLSAETFATSLSESGNKNPIQAKTDATQEIEEPKVLPPNLVPIVDIEVRKIDKYLIDIDDILGQLAQKSDQSLVQEFGLKVSLDNSRSQLLDLQKTLEGYKKAYASEKEIQDKVRLVDMEVIKIESTTPKDIVLNEKTDFVQSTAKEEVSLAVEELFKNIPFSENEKKEYIQLNEKKKDKFKVEVTAKIITITYMNGEKNEKTLVKKVISYSDPQALEDVIIIETIPKSVAESSDEITFQTENSEVINKDPVVKFGFLKFNYGGEVISYTLDKKVAVEDLRDSRSIALLSLNELTKKRSSTITGFSIISLESLGIGKSQSIFIVIGIIAIICLGGYYIFYVKKWRFGAMKHYPRTMPDSRIRGNSGISINTSQRDSSSALLAELYGDIKSAKADVADRLYPVFNQIHTKIESNAANSDVKEFNYAYVIKLLGQANLLLENNEKQKAMQIYPQISFAYQNLPAEYKAEIYQRCAELHRKLS